jgi:2Fe-2S ferredoxin
MATIKFIAHDGAEHAVSAQPGLSLMEVAVNNDISGIEGVCGGAMSCCTCLVHVREGWLDRLGEPTGVELELIAAHSHARSNSRLACQIRVRDDLDGLAVDLPPEQN